jgi:hypothetical protein
MKLRALVATVLFALVAVSVSAQSLAEASAEAKKIKHEWPLVGVTAPSAIVADAPAATDATQAPVVVEEKKPSPTVLEDQRVKAAALFGTRLIAVRTVMDARASNAFKYSQACANKQTVFAPVVVGLAVIAPLTLNETTPQCRTLGAEMMAQAATVESERRDIIETARKQKIYPGVVRTIHAGDSLTH